MKRGGLGIPDPRLLTESASNTSKASIKVLVGSLLGGTNLNYVAHKGFIHKASADGWKRWGIAEKAVLSRWKELADRAGVNHLRKEMENMALLTAIPHCLNVTELSWEEF